METGTGTEGESGKQQPEALSCGTEIQSKVPVPPPHPRGMTPEKLEDFQGRIIKLEREDMPNQSDTLDGGGDGAEDAMDGQICCLGGGSV